MKILLLTTHLRMGGVPIYVVTLATALKRLGHKVFVASSGGVLVDRLNEEGIPHIKLAINVKAELHPKLLAGIYRLQNFIKWNSIEIIHTHTRVTQVMGEIAAFLTGCRHISTCHGFFKPRFGRRLFGCWGKSVIAISDAVSEHLIKDFRVDASRVKLVYNGIDLHAPRKLYSDEEKKNIRNRLGLKAGPVVGIIARLSSVKGHKYLIDAMRFIVSKIKDAQLLIVGEGEEKEPLKLLAKELGISDLVVFVKSVSDTAEVFSVIDVFALPSLKEGFGLVLLEALSCEVPVVASNVGGINSIVKDEATGLLVPPRDSQSMGMAIVRLLEDKSLAKRLAQDGQKFVRENFSLEDMAKKVEKVYQGII